jgi:hypothetical protein
VLSDRGELGSYQRNTRRLGKQRGAKVAQIDIARRLSEAIWHMSRTRRHRTACPARGAWRERATSGWIRRDSVPEQMWWTTCDGGSYTG